MSQSKLRLVPITIRDAKAYVYRIHRHHDPPRGALFAIGVEDEVGELRGVAIVGRPVAMMSQDGFTAEVLRVATDGCPNACSFLYGRANRAARAIGYTRVLTKTLTTEPGTSLEAAGWKKTGISKGGSWDRPSRRRKDHYPTQAKFNWEAPCPVAFGKTDRPENT
jgi:hypothetical protein